VQWKPWQVPNRVLAGLGEMDEWPAEMAVTENPILRVSVAQAEAAVRDLMNEAVTATGAKA